MPPQTIKSISCGNGGYRMVTQITKKLLSAIPVLIIVSMILFYLVSVLPGDAAAGIAAVDASEEYLAKLREDRGLNRASYLRYLDWIIGMTRGDFGKSLITRQPVIEKIKIRLPVTIELAFLAMLIAVIIAIPLGIISAIKRNSLLDLATSILAMLSVTMPHFWLGMLLILLFSVRLGWFPASGYTALIDNPIKNLLGMIMPAIAIGTGFAATVMRQTRSALLDVMDQEYIITAKAKGLRNSTVIWKHALRNSLIPVVTVVSMQTGRLIGGAAVTETIFAMPGIGREIVDAILSRDYPVVMGLIMVVAMVVTLINVFMDVIYIIIDPRISYGEKR